MSRNEVRNGARKAPNPTKIATRLTLSKRTGRRIRYLMHAAPIKASAQLLTYHDNTMPRGTPPWSSPMTCAGSVARMSASHHSSGASSRAPSRTAFGGQSVDAACELGVSASPTLAAA
jgi:hypothetical protein